MSILKNQNDWGGGGGGGVGEGGGVVLGVMARALAVPVLLKLRCVVIN